MIHSTRKLIDDRSRVLRDCRLEVKFVIDTSRVERVLAAMREFAIEAEAPSGETSWEVLTTYYDDNERSLLRKAVQTPLDCYKIRTREYIRLDSPVPRDRTWLEIKNRLGEQSEKIRFPVPRSDLRRILEGDESLLDPTAQAAQAEIARTGSGFPLMQVAELCYRRRACFLEGLGRITLDSDLTYVLEQRDQPTAGLRGSGNGAAYLEVKGARPPEWLEEAIERQAPETFSKLLYVTRSLQLRQDRDEPESPRAGRTSLRIEE